MEIEEAQDIKRPHNIAREIGHKIWMGEKEKLVCPICYGQLSGKQYNQGRSCNDCGWVIGDEEEMKPKDERNE